MRALREMRPPGVYPALEEPRAKPLTMVDTRIAGFVGIAARGPLDEPVLIASYGEFLDVFGAAAESYLPTAVEGFFANGGGACYVVRVAHRPRPAADGQLVVGAEHAASAERLLLDGWGGPCLAVRAVNEGRWGNQVWVRCQTVAGASTLLTLDLEMGAGEARLSGTRGFERGALVRIHDRESSDYVILTEVEDKVIRWSVATPIVRAYRAAGPTFVEVLEVELYASFGGRREAFRGLQLSPLSRRYLPRVVGDESQLIRAIDLRSAAPLPHHQPAAGPAAKLAGGRDGVDTLTVADFIGDDHGPGARTGLRALAAVEAVALLAVPDVMLAYRRTPGPKADLDVLAVHDALVEICELQKDRFAILDGPPTKDYEVVRRWRRRLASSYAALYYPWIAVGGGDGERHFCPPSGHIAGVFARCDRDAGVHKAPANEVVVGAGDLMLNMSEDHLGLLNGDGINALRGYPGRGIRIWGARTTADDPSWRYVNVRRLFIMLRRALEEGTEWVVFEPNAERTWTRLGRDIDEFLKGLWEAGYFAGATPEESYFVRCNEETNPPEVREAGWLMVEVGVAPALPAEYIIFSISQKLGAESPETERAHG